MPLLSLAQELKKSSLSPKIVYIGLKDEKVDGLESQYGLFDEVFWVSSGKFRRYHGESLFSHLTDVKTLVLNARDVVRVGRGVFASRRLLKKIQPAVVFSKGGFVVVPVGIAAHHLGIPIVTHDSDTLPGLANRIIGRWAAVHATGMPTEYYDYPKDKTIYTGIPVGEKFRPPTPAQIMTYKKHLGLPAQGEVLLVAGGGLGSRTVNSMVANISAGLLEQLPSVYVLHLCGKGNEAAVEAEYADQLNGEQQGRVKVVGFTDEFYKFSAVSDVVVARTGATTLAELAMQSRAVITIPSPFLSGGHQLKNADMLKKQHAAEVAYEDIPSSEFAELVVKLLKNQTARQKLASNLHGLAKPHAARDIAKILLNFSDKG